MSIAEEAQVMKRLGAVEALNCDGGGSAVLVTKDGGIVNRPSDTTGERELGDPIVIVIEPQR